MYAERLSTRVASLARAAARMTPIRIPGRRFVGGGQCRDHGTDRGARPLSERAGVTGLTADRFAGQRQ